MAAHASTHDGHERPQFAFSRFRSVRFVGDKAAGSGCCDVLLSAVSLSEQPLVP